MNKSQEPTPRTIGHSVHREFYLALSEITIKNTKLIKGDDFRLMLILLIFSFIKLNC